jgi:ankyrin repeat protein
MIFSQSNYKRDFVKALSANDISQIEQIINDNTKHISESDKRLMYAFSLDYSHKDSALEILKLLQNKNINPSQFDLFNAINRNHSDEVVQFIVDQDVKPNGEILLFAAEKNRFNLVNQFAKMGADVNYQYPAGKSYANGMTALLYAIREGDFETIKFLVEQGAQMNVADNSGYTPASLAKELELTEIFDYLIEHGAADVEPINIVEEVSPSNVKNAAAENSGQGIASLIDNKSLTLQGGKYRLTGGSAEIIIPGNVSMGAITFTSQGVPMMGAFRIEKNNMIIMISGKTHTYTIDSETSFSGYGERWVRTGN